MAAGPVCQPYVQASYHDVPEGSSELIQELQKGPWPQRQLVSKLYHAFKQVEVAAPSIYEEVLPRRSEAAPRRSACGS
jgi:hypothetical protein